MRALQHLLLALLALLAAAAITATALPTSPHQQDTAPMRRLRALFSQGLLAAGPQLTLAEGAAVRLAAGPGLPQTLLWPAGTADANADTWPDNLAPLLTRVSSEGPLAGQVNGDDTFGYFSQSLPGGAFTSRGLYRQRLDGAAGYELLELNITAPAAEAAGAIAEVAAESHQLSTAGVAPRTPWRPAVAATEMAFRALSFNIRYGSASDGLNGWPQRRPQVFDILRKQAPLVAGLQEVLHFQLQELLAELPEYRHVGVGRDDGLTAGEYAPIFYRADRLQVLESGTFWFCDQPHIPGCRTYGNNLPRICTWAKFFDVPTGRAFYHFNVHLDHMSSNSRIQSAQQLVDTIDRYNLARLPTLITGDFNNHSENATEVRVLQDAGYMDTFRQLDHDPRRGLTYHEFTGKGIRKIDYVWLWTGANLAGYNVTAVDMLTQHVSLPSGLGTIYPSDHYPILADVAWHFG
ncbi:hypothetical protein H696_02430 [Fonticula alba]|uniref:Endonuclease/exonuclease/phosphatase domain-containing protein n=1 Tax=Fonticula alba TaxID=691883 RepID=A0A058ZAP2_FONAL|nr:hypothetical protein H696_02430 [Fonticula alba]KCV71485.1 hypothetical protein H696_02430 [Fonticula alba]|eukprot:XP_009494608.1 hypothetical protein H696_02430 [Fonticula alba]